MIICILGDYGVGKDTFADMLIEEIPKAKKIKSYTTRPPRYPNESTHIFIPFTSCVCHLAMKKMTTPTPDKINVPETWLAYSIINGHFYWTEKEQFDTNICNIYVIDDVGLRQVIDSGFDDVYVIEVKRPEYLIDVPKERINREKAMLGFDYSNYVNNYVNNDEGVEKLEIQAHLIAKDILFNTFK